MRLDVGADVAVAPLVHDLARRAGGVGPVPQLERHGDAEPGDALVLRGVEPGAQALDAGADEIDGLARRRIAVGILQHGADVAEEIDQHQLGAAAADLQAEEIGAVGIERHRDGWLADLAAHRRLAQQQAFVLQLAHDDRDGLRRQPGHAGDLGLGKAAVLADERKHQALVVVAHAALVGAAMVKRLSADLGEPCLENAGLHPSSSRAALPPVFRPENGVSRQPAVNNK